MNRKLRIAAIILVVLPMLFSFALADGENIAVNGDFEQKGSNDLPTGWYVSAFNDQTGVYGEWVELDGRGGVGHLVSPEGNDARLVQLITIEPNSYYRFTCDIKCANVTGSGGANVSILDSFAGTDSITGDTDWNTVSFVGKSNADQTEIELALRIGGYGAESSGEAWFDNVSVVKLDSEPQGVVAKEMFLEQSNNNNNNNDDGESAPGMPYSAAMFAAAIVTAIAAFAIYKLFIVKPEIPALSEDKKSTSSTVLIVLLIALIVRVAVNFMVKSTGAENVYFGHSTDMNCFMSWGNTMCNNGPVNFYEAAGFADYPPGYMYLLWICSGISNLLGVQYSSALHSLIMKLPTIAADLAVSYMIYRIARRFNKTPRTSIFLMCLIAFNPVVVFISAGWGQIDMLLTLGLLASFMLFIDKPVSALDTQAEPKQGAVDVRKILAGLVFGATILIKPQALMVGPLFAVAYIAYICAAGKGKYGKAILSTLLAVIAALAVIAVFALPFMGSGGITVILDKYLGTATSYPYASIEAFNFMALIGANWVKVSSPMFLGLSYEIWGWAFIALTIVVGSWLYLKGKKRSQFALILCAAFMLAGMFTFGQYMHERYLFPVLALLIVAAIAYNDKRLYISFAGFSVSMLLNTMAAFIIVDNQSARYEGYDTFILIGSLLTVLTFLYFAYVCFSIIFKGNTRPMFGGSVKAPAAIPVVKPVQRIQPADTHTEGASPLKLPDPVDNKLHFTKKDRLFCFVLTAVYCVIALLNLGTTQAPQTHYEATVTSEPVQISFGKQVEIGSIYVYGGIANDGTFTISNNGGQNISYKQEYGNMFRWHNASSVPMTGAIVTFAVESGKVNLCELAFFDKNGDYIPASVTGAGIELVDEPNQVPAVKDMSYLNGMYFDELYHGRTAYEHLHNESPYENSHPPLGKIFISIGVAIFGMNAFGWRIIGTLFGVAMVPLMYCFGKRLFKKSEYALLMALLMAFDLMHFAQSRISTVDVYAVFFIILMFYYMYQYYTMNFYVDGLKKTLKPLGLAGLFFGIGVASKWICVYAGFGLALILMFSLIKRFKEYQRFKDEGGAGSFPKLCIQTLLWCCVFYIAVPAVIYCASYIPYFIYNGDNTLGKMLKTVLYYQEYMYSYHSGLTATHAFQSAWYEWPLIFRPVWFYRGNVDPGMVSTISTFGSPAVWWPCFFGTIALAIENITKRIKCNKGMVIGYIGILANLGAWVFVTRCTFEYHYFATVPFIILLAVSYLYELEKRHSYLSFVKWGWMGVTLLVFGMFYPFVSGAIVSETWLKLMQWLPGWTFLGYTMGAEGYIFGACFVVCVILSFVIYGRHAKNKAEARLTLNGTDKTQD